MFSFVVLCFAKFGRMGIQWHVFGYLSLWYLSWWSLAYAGTRLVTGIRDGMVEALDI